jgi:hypothetical protein
VYNLIQNNPNDALPKIVSSPPVVANLVKIINHWKKIPRDKLVYVLDHYYTHANHRFSGLKGRDASIARIFSEVASIADLQVCLAQFSFHLQTNGIMRDHDHFLWNNEYPRHEEIDVKASYKLNSLIYFNDNPYLDELAISEKDLINTNADDIYGDSKEKQNDTGNEGVEIERWYSRSAIVLWPSNTELKRSDDATSSSSDSDSDGSDDSVSYFRKFLKRNRRK